MTGIEPLGELDLVALSSGIRARELSSRELTDFLLERIDTVGNALNCFGAVYEERARKHADACDRLLAAGVYLGPLHGIPIAVKDCIDVHGSPTTMGAVDRQDAYPEEDAAVVRRLFRAGAVFLGKTNLYEWAYGGPSSLWGDVKNPWDPDKTAGFSSNGSAAAVAAGLAAAALGTDNGGSVRIPAAACGVFGIKPSYGLVSRFGAPPLSSSTNCIGPLTRDVEGAAWILEAIAGFDDRDPSTWNRPAPERYSTTLRQSIRGLRVGVVKLGEDDVSPEVAGAVDTVCGALREYGCTLTSVSLPSFADARTANWVIGGAEQAEHHRRGLESESTAYQATVRTLLTRGLFLSAPDYVHAQRVGQLFASALAELFRMVEVVVLPVMPTPPWDRASFHRLEYDSIEEDDLNAAIRYNTIFNLTGNPAASIPAGFTETGLPLAVQIAGPVFGDGTVLRVAKWLEQALPFSGRRPVLANLPPD